MDGGYREVSPAVVVAVHVQQLVDVDLHLRVGRRARRRAARRAARARALSRPSQQIHHTIEFYHNNTYSCRPLDPRGFANYVGNVRLSGIESKPNL